MDGTGPLHVASQRGYIGVVKVLLDAGAAVNQAGVSGLCDAVLVYHLALRAVGLVDEAIVVGRIGVPVSSVVCGCVVVMG
jgi:hypothetical protein